MFQIAHPATTSLSHASATPLRMGGRGTDEFSYHGAVDEVRLWSIARTESEIAADRLHSISSSNPGYGSLVSYWRLEEGMGTSTSDARGSANGLLSAASWIKPGAPLSD